MVSIENRSHGMFSDCSTRLSAIVEYYNANLSLPPFVNSEKQFSHYKPPGAGDITFELFKDYNSQVTPLLDSYVHASRCAQNDNYHTHLDYKNISGIMKKYFSPSDSVNNIIKELENKYKIDYKNTCVLFYRGTDKIQETSLPTYEDFISRAKLMLEKNKNIKFLIQSDEQDFIDAISTEFPDNSFYFKDETVRVKSSEVREDAKTQSVIVFRLCDLCPDVLLNAKNWLAITIIMSRCEHIVLNPTNSSVWIALFRGNSKNIQQYLYGAWLTGRLSECGEARPRGSISK